MLHCRKKQQLVHELFQPAHRYLRPQFIGADLSRMTLCQALANTGFDPAQATLFTVEGLIYYLPEPAVRQLFGSIAQLSAPNSVLYFDFLHASALEGRGKLPAGYKVVARSVANKREPFMSGIEDDRAAIQCFLDSCTSPPGMTNSQCPESTVPCGGCTYCKDRRRAGTCGLGGLMPTADAAKPSNMLQLVQYITPKEMVAQQLPRLSWDDDVPPILSFYSFAVAKVAPHAGHLTTLPA